MVTTFYPPHAGGIEYHVENISKRLVRRGHKVTVLTSMLPTIEMPSVETTPHGVEIFRLKAFFPLSRFYPSLSSQGFSWHVRKAIEQIVRKRQIEVIHAHGHHYYLTWRAIDAACRLKVPSVLTMHGLYALSPSDSIAQVEEEIFNLTIFKQELKKVSATIGLTQKITKFAKKYGPSTNNYLTIPNGVNFNVFSKNRDNRLRYRQKYGIDNDKTVVLFLGRFASIKGVLELASAAKIVVEEDSDVFFLFVGEGPLHRELADYLQPIKENSMIIGWLPPDKIHEPYLASDIFVLPSKSEALPLTILEAMAAKLHIVTTPVGGVPEVLEKYRRKTLLRNGSPNEISGAILHLTQQKSSSPLNEESASLADYIKIFDWEKIAEKHSLLYENLLDH